MPYKRIGRKVFKKEQGRWKLKQTAKNVENAKSTLRLLRGIEHGFKPTGKKSFTTVKKHKRKGKRVKKHRRRL